MNGYDILNHSSFFGTNFALFFVIVHRRDAEYAEKKSHALKPLRHCPMELNKP